ncbi:collagen alpha-1(VIII) chain-like [Dreissena polymorpha]|uniref:C1q domain-containing protein n=1 Tax=Dreissena polymorpha TaxID=45954 RepID=A0A9D4EXZ1_DREPO|nr:collagen alpha-1(VIII) chain-like [Dreissena polymorpha]KAH3787913.1 hypothetical protein DPMN_166044 [Dreissena polymorpha]
MAMLIIFLFILGSVHFSQGTEDASCRDCNTRLDYMMKVHADLLMKYETLLEMYESNRDRIEALEGKIKDAKLEKGSSQVAAIWSTEEAKNVTANLSAEAKQEETEENHQKASIRIFGKAGQRNTHHKQVRDVVDQPNKQLLSDNAETVDTGGTMRDTRSFDVEENVAFSAYLDQELTHLHVGHIVRCNQIVINDGSGYNAASGVFTAHVPGVYFFAFTIDTHAGEMNVRLVQDGVNLFGAVSTPRIMGGNYGVTRLGRGQSVWLEIVHNDDVELIGMPTFHMVSFSGFLLYQ